MKVGLSRAKSPDKFDFVLMAYLIVMAITSFVSIYSSFGIVGAQAGMGYLTKQIMWFMAVSYTHLDVYKRQNVGFPVFHPL